MSISFIFFTYRNLDLLCPLGEAALSPVEATSVAALNLNVTGGHLKQIENKDIRLENFYSSILTYGGRQG